MSQIESPPESSIVIDDAAKYWDSRAVSAKLRNGREVYGWQIGRFAHASRLNHCLKNVAKFTSYRIRVLWKLISDVGFGPLAGLLLQPARYAYYLLSKSKVTK